MREVFFEKRDYQLKVNYAPLKTPEAVGLKINGTAVTAISGQDYAGYWSSYSQFSSLTGNLEFVLTSTWNDVRCNINNVQINYTKTDLKGLPSIESSQGEQYTHWNITRSGGLNFFDNRLSSYSINFTIPKSWNNYTIFNGPINKTNDITGIHVSGNYRTLQVSNAGNGTYWFINATTINLLQSINIFKLGSITHITEALNTETIGINGTFSQIISQNDGSINFSAYSPDITNNYLAYSILTSTFSSGTIITVDNWDLSSITSDFGIYRIQIVWLNDSEAGIRDITLTINKYTSSSPPNGNGNPPPPEDFPILIIFLITISIIGVGIGIFLKKRSND